MPNHNNLFRSGALFAPVFSLFLFLTFTSMAAEAAEQDTAPPAAELPKPKPQWSGSIGGGLQVESGRTSGRGASVTGDLAKSFSNNNVLSFEGALNHSTFKLGGKRLVAANNMSIAGQWVHPLNKRFFFVDRIFIMRDTVLGVRSREFNATGIGINLLLSKKGRFYIVPGYSVGRQSTSVREINGVMNGFTAYEKFEYQLERSWSITQWSLLRTNQEHSSDMSIKGYIGLTAPALYKRLFLSLGVDYMYEGVLSPEAVAGGATRNDAVFSVKFHYRVGK